MSPHPPRAPHLPPPPPITGSRPSGALALAMTLLGACAADPASDDDVATPDASDTALGEPDAADTAPVDTETPDIGADTGSDATAGDTNAADAPEIVLTCDDDERPVGDQCRLNFDRACWTDDHCRVDERCSWRTGEDPSRPGTCMYQVPAPLVCPGNAACPEANGALRVGMAARVTTPTGWELPRPGYSERVNRWGMPSRFVGDVTDTTTFCDCGRDFVCPPEPEFADCTSLGEWVGPDADGTEGDGYMQGAWIAGFGNSKNAVLCPDDWLPPACEGAHCCAHRLAHDDMWARAIVFDQGDTRLAWVVLDTVGLFYSDARTAAAMLDPALGVDWLVVSSTHTHNAPDTIGQWGPGVYGADLPTDTGAYPVWMNEVRTNIAAVVTDAVAALEPADLYVTHLDTGWEGFAARDTRDPFVFDDRLTGIHVVRDGGDPAVPADTIGSVVNWHAHPEAIAEGNALISSDYPHWVRQHLEQGFAEPGVEGFPARPGLGGVAIFASGSVGGLLNPLHRTAIGRDGVPHSINGFDKARALGERLADAALAAFSTPCQEDATLGCARRVDDERLTFATSELVVDVTNVNFHAGGMGLEVFDRPIYDWRLSDGNIRSDNMPKVLTAVTQIRLGPIVMQTFPGELFPEIVTGLRDGFVVRNPILGDYLDANCAADRRTRLPADSADPRFGCFVDDDNPNPPDLDAFPVGPPLGARLGGEYLVVIGLGNDQIGYLVPSYDFETDPVVGALRQAPGHHYEEQVSVGDVVDSIVAAVDGLTALLQ